MTQMTERTKKVADFLQANEGTFTPTEIEAATGVNFRGIVTIVRALDKNYGMPELASRVVSRVKRMKMVAVPQV